MKALSLLAALLMGAAALAACSERDEEPATATPTPTRTPTATGTARPTAAPTPTPPPGDDLARRLAQGPEYFIYVAGAGDTIASIADMFDGVVGERDRRFEDELRTLNELAAGTRLAPGYELAIPLRLPETASLFQDNSIGEAMRQGAPLTTPPLLLPGFELRDALSGRVALYQVELEDGSEPGEGRGFILTFASTDRTAVKAGELDFSARYTGALFLVAGGSLARRLRSEHPDAFEHVVGGYTYYVAVVDPTAPPAQEIAAGLIPSSP